MPSFRRKLAQLNRGPRESQAAPDRHRSDRSPDSRPLAPPPEAPSPRADAARGDPGGEGAGGHLDRLRARLAVALRRESADKGPAMNATCHDPDYRLATTAQDSPWGPYQAIRAAHPPTDSVGVTTLTKALQASPALLSLLGLTPQIARCDLAGALYLDTETTGLGTGTGNLPFLVGLCWYEPAAGHFVLEQLYLRDPDDEVALLERVRERIAMCELIVSYNGKSFDMPVLRNRLVMNRRPPLPARPQLDLLHLVRRVHARRSWPKSLTVVEQEVLGYGRGPDVAGAEVAERYLHFLRTGSEEGLDAVVDHNASDVLSLVGLVGLYGEKLDTPHESPAPPGPSRVEAGPHREPPELTAMARVMRRAGALDAARQVAELAVQRGAGPEGLRVRGEIAKARGDKQQALEDFEAYAEQVSDPFVRLELAKLYEHFMGAPQQALEVVELGTAENEAKDEHRQARLRRKVASRQAKHLPGGHR